MPAATDPPALPVQAAGRRAGGAGWTEEPRGARRCPGLARFYFCKAGTGETNTKNIIFIFALRSLPQLGFCQEKPRANSQIKLK